MRASEHALAPQPPPFIPIVAPEFSSASFDPYTTLSDQLREHDLKMSANFQRMEHRVDNDMQYTCASIRYLQTCVDDTYSRNAWPVPLSRVHSSTFLLWVLRLTLCYLLQLLPRHQLLPKIQTFRKSDPFLLMTKRGREILWSYLGV